MISVAVEIFYERGYAATSVEDVAAALGILKGSLYYYIDSKEDLLYQIVSEVHEDARQIIDDVLGRVDLNARDRIGLYVRSQVGYNARNVSRVAVYYRDVNQLSSERLADIHSRQRRHFRALVGLIEEARAEGLIASDIDGPLAARSVLSSVIWIYTWFRPNGKVTPDDLADFSARFVLGGLIGFHAAPLPLAAETAS